MCQDSLVGLGAPERTSRSRASAGGQAHYYGIATEPRGSCATATPATPMKHPLKTWRVCSRSLARSAGAGPAVRSGASGCERSPSRRECVPGPGFGIAGPCRSLSCRPAAERATREAPSPNPRRTAVAGGPALPRMRRRRALTARRRHRAASCCDPRHWTGEPAPLSPSAGRTRRSRSPQGRGQPPGLPQRPSRPDDR